MSGELGEARGLKVTKKMLQDQLTEYVAEKLKQVKMCTLVTSKGDIPRGTPLEYFSDGLTLYISPDLGTKTNNLKANPNVSVSIYNNLSPDWETDWRTVWGMQITGKGELFEEGDLGYDSVYERAREMINFESYYRALGRKDTKFPKGRQILKVTPSKIELLEFGLIPEGFDCKQVWQANV